MRRPHVFSTAETTLHAKINGEPVWMHLVAPLKNVAPLAFSLPNPHRDTYNARLLGFEKQVMATRGGRMSSLSINVIHRYQLSQLGPRSM